MTTILPPTVPAGLEGSGFTPDVVAALGSLVAPDAWTVARRTAAAAAFEQLPMPSKRDEHWRFTSLRGIDLAKIASFTPAEHIGEAIALANNAVAASETPAARIIAVNGEQLDGDGITYGELPVGVIVAPLAEALRDHAELVHKHFGTAVPITNSVNDKFVALNEAAWTTGTFVYVPRGVRVEQQIEHITVQTVDGATLQPRLLVVLEDNAQATVVEQFIGLDGVAGNGFANAVTELIVGNGAHLEHVTVQDWPSDVANFSTHRLLAGRDAQVSWSTLGLGAARGKARLEVRLVGAGANVKLTGAYFLDGRQNLDYDTQQFHEAPNAYSDLSFRGVLTDHAHSVWRGMIDVAEGAQGTDSYQENRNLLLTPTSHADSIPGLQIEANEVRCTHGATISKVDQDQLFYLQARGISRDEATRMIVRGFYTPALDRIELETLREHIREALFSRLDG